ncbi:MAG: hypothetical protein L0H36_01640 [bacterium]|nr:hypothetical protein [bacterium]
MLRVFATWLIRIGLLALVLITLIGYDKISIYHLGKPIHGLDQYLVAAAATGFILALGFVICTQLNQAVLRAISKSIERRMEIDSSDVAELEHPGLALVMLTFVPIATVIFSIVLYVAALVVPAVITLWGLWATLLCGLMIACAWVIPSIVTIDRSNI